MSYVLRPEFVGEWRYVVEPSLFYNIRLGGALLDEKAFNRLVRPFSDTDNTAGLLLKYAEAQVHGVTYDPSRPHGVINRNGQSYINVFRPSRLRPMEGDVAPFMEFMEGLVPAESDRENLLKWFATLIARPDIRMIYGVLMISEAQGVGKSTLMEKIIAPLVGEHNVSVPSALQVVTGAFNSWLVRKRLVCVHEIYAEENAKAYNSLKTAITEKVITINEKYVKEYEIENWAHFICSSNSPRALPIKGEEDRRWFVPGIGENVRDMAFWTTFNNWLTRRGGLEAIAYWTREYVEKHGAVGPGDRAPESEAKKQLILNNLSPGRMLIRKWGEHLRALDEDFVIPIADIAEALAGLHKPEHHTTVGRELRAMGLEARALGHAKLTYVVHIDRERAKQEGTRLADLKEAGNKILDALINGETRF
jgi:hypothetical protein